MIAALLAAAALATAIVTTAPIDPVARLAERITQLANRDRAARGVALLRVDARLTQAAQGKAEDMLRRDYFDHVDPNGRAPWDLLDSIGYRFVSVGENISRGLSDPERMHERWTASPPHRRNILSKDFTHIGVGAVREPAGSFRVVVLFARPATSAAEHILQQARPGAAQHEQRTELRAGVKPTRPRAGGISVANWYGIPASPPLRRRARSPDVDGRWKIRLPARLFLQRGRDEFHFLHTPQRRSDHPWSPLAHLQSGSG